MAATAIAAFAALATALSVRRQLVRNELFIDLGQRGARLPGMLGTVGGGGVGVILAVGFAAASLPVPLVLFVAPIAAFAVAPGTPIVTLQDQMAGRSTQWAYSPWRAWAPGLFEPRRAVCAALVLAAGVVFGRAASGEATWAMHAAAGIATLAALRLLADPAGLLLLAWVQDGTSTFAKVARPLGARIGVAAAAHGCLAALAGGTVSIGWMTATGTMAVLVGATRLAYANRELDLYRDGALLVGLGAAIAGLFPPALGAVAIAASYVIVLRAARRISPRA